MIARFAVGTLAAVVLVGGFLEQPSNHAGRSATAVVASDGDVPLEGGKVKVTGLQFARLETGNRCLLMLMRQMMRKRTAGAAGCHRIAAAASLQIELGLEDGQHIAQTEFEQELAGLVAKVASLNVAQWNPFVDALTRKTEKLD